METPNARFEEIFAELNHRCLDDLEFSNALEELLPEKAERDAFCLYQIAISLPHIADPTRILTPAQFVQITDTINFLNPVERARLLPGLQWEYRPWVPVGYKNNTLYRLLPSIGSLSPQQYEHPLTNYELLPTTFLGVNTTVQPHEPALPLNRRAANLSEQSTITQSAESDDKEAPGFIFHELGVLQYLECDTIDEMPTTLEEGDNCESDWEQTGFCIVARLSDLGYLHGIYVLYNMNPLHEDGTRKQVTHGEWGLLPGLPGEQFSCARIGNMMGGFGFNVKLEWTDKIDHPVELVRVVRSSTGGAMRITVDSKYKL
ncbi:hypothetical protein V8C37DRAFT_418387 [Trichoderma ceciliae]